ncbi:hypothetical protein [Bradyrhizobium sp. 27S5]|uniref:hypothetical protein n=1 Tax=Bradyrhizobium sp. 27S5 TaxID=3139728 RepID=UPI0030CA64F3
MMIENESGMWERFVKPKNSEESIRTARKYFERELPKLTADATRHQRQSALYLQLFNELNITRDGLQPTKSSKWNGAWASDLTVAARSGDKDAEAVLRKAAVGFLRRRDSLPVELYEFVIAQLGGTTGAAKGGRPPVRNLSALRDHSIAYMVQQVMRCSDRRLTATRNEATRKTESACSMVTKAFNLAIGVLHQKGECKHEKKLSEKRVSEIWRARNADFPKTRPQVSLPSAQAAMSHLGWVVPK